MIVSFTAFTLYYICFVTAFTLRPIGFSTEMLTEGWINRYSEPFPGRYGKNSTLQQVKPVINATSRGLVEWCKYSITTTPNILAILKIDFFPIRHKLC